MVSPEHEEQLLRAQLAYQQAAKALEQAEKRKALPAELAELRRNADALEEAYEQAIEAAMAQ